MSQPSQMPTTPPSATTESSASVSQGRHQFTCKIPNPGGLTLAEKIGNFAQVARPAMREATCLIEASEFRVVAKDMYNTEVTLMKTPVESIRRAVTQQVSAGQQAKDVFLQSVGAAIGIAVAIVGVLLYKILTDDRMAPFQTGRFLGLAVTFLVVFGIGGAVVGAIRAAATSSLETEKCEFRLYNEQQECTLAFRVDAKRKQEISDIIVGVGWAIVPNL